MTSRTPSSAMGLLFSLGLFLFTAPALSLDLQNFSCPQGQELSRLKGENLRTMFFTYHNGYLIQNRHGGSMTKVWDLNDPSAPVLVNSYDNNLWEGQHTHTFIGETELYHWSGKHQVDLSQLPALKEARPIFNASDMVNSYYPFGFSDVANSYQYQQVGHFSIHDLRTPDQDKLSTVNVLDDTGFEGHVNLIGNLLIVTGDNETPQGVATYDLSDPRNPVLLDSIRTMPDGTPLIKAYDSVPVWGHYVILAQNGDTTAQRGVDIIDFSDPKNLKHVGRFDFEGRTRYAQFQDNFMFIGNAKVDMNTFETVATFPEGGGEYTLPVGNLLITAGMHRPDNGRVWCHQSQPDNQAPKVLFHSPAANATQVPVTSRIGVVIPETLDIKTINNKNIVLRPLHKKALAVDIVSSDHDVINITPKALLEHNTTYEFIIFANGLSDVAGNALSEDFRFVFATGKAVSTKKPPQITHLSVNHEQCNHCQQVNVEAKAITSDNSQQYSVNWGDGNKTAFSTSNTLAHHYTKPGIYNLQLKVKNSAGLYDYATRNIVIGRTTALGGISSSTIIADHTHNLIWNVNPDNNSVTALHANSGKKMYEIEVAKNPRSLTLDRQGNIWVSSADDATITIINCATGTILHTIALPAGSQPQGIVHANTQNIAYVAAMGTGYLYRIDTQHKHIIDRLYLGPWPRALALTHDDKKLYASRFISPDHQGEVYAIDTTTFNKASTVALHMDEHPDSDRNGRGLPNYLISLAIAPDGKTLWVGSKKDNLLRGGMHDGKALTFENSVRSIISFIDITHDVEIINKRIDIDNHELPSAIHFSPTGAIAYIGFRGNNRITAYDVQSLQVLDRLTTHKTPIGITSIGNHLYVHNYLSRSIQKADLFTGPQQSLGPFSTHWQTQTVSSENLPASVLEGKQLFNDADDPRISRDGYISCASCHLDAEHDGRTWDFSDRGEGLRNTIALRGRAGTAHGKLHWSANFDEIQDFEHDIRHAFGGRGLLNDKDFDDTINTLDQYKAGRSHALDAIATYTASLTQFGISPWRNQQQLSHTAQRGKLIYQQLNCSGCHSGPAFTDSPQGLRHDVGTLKVTSGQRLASNTLNGIDTPTLKALWHSAPYFHDGSANSLLEVINQKSHGNGQQLSPAEKEDLIAYLLQIDDLENNNHTPAATFKLSTLKANDTLAPNAIALGIESSFLDITAVTYFANDKAIATVNQPPFNTLWHSDSPGRQRIYAKAIHRNGSASLSPDVWVNIIGKSLTCTIGSTQRWTGGFVTKDIVVTNVGENTMQDWTVNIQFSDKVVYREAWDTIVQQQDATHFLAKGYSDDRDLAPGESIAFGFIVNHAQDTPNITPQCIVENAVVPKSIAANTRDDDIDGIANTLDACPTTPINNRVNAIGCSEQERDDDKDGIANSEDACLYSAKGIDVDNYGCSAAQYRTQYLQQEFTAQQKHTSNM